MNSQMNSEAPPKIEQPNGTQSSLPSLAVPKGGGAIKGIGEKFAANPVTGTGSLTIPLPLSPSRSGFTPGLALSYDSGSGNGPFGFGWSIGSPGITRRTDKGLPQYFDNEESDVFILSGAEDLVPVLDEDGSQVERQSDGYRITRYRPRIEGLFACIERWTSLTNTEDIFWRSISSDNVTTFYGKTTESRIFDPTDRARIFSWLICQSYDDKGNAVVYEYQAEDSAGVNDSQVEEKNRTSAGRSANRYLKRVKYGNRKPNRDENTWKATDPLTLPAATWMFELVFDYDEGHIATLPGNPELVRAQINQTQNWTTREDPFSSYRAGFEVRTYRLCRRVLMFHHFPESLQTPDCLVRSTEFTYDASPIASFITEVTQSGYSRQPDGVYRKKSFPPLSLQYSKAVINDEIEAVDPASLENLPAGAGFGPYEWLDLDGEGLNGVLSEQIDGWYYKRNESPLATTRTNGKEIVVARFAPVAEVATLPSLAEAAIRRHQFLDLAGDGNLDLVQFEKPASGFFERSDDERWKSFVPFNSLPNVSWNDPNLKFIDLTGDGHADILITEDQTLTWYPSLGEDGFGRAVRMPVALDEEQGPAVVFADGTQAIVTADLSGDGLTDIVRIRNGEVCYWPNLGYGRFGAKVTMDNAPWFDTADQFDQKRLRLADIDGSGTTDIIYFERDRVAIYRNECGNSWAAAEYVESFPPVDDLASVNAVDLLGIGTACLVWSSPLPGQARRQMRYIDLMGRQKPHLLTRVANNLGTETLVEYAPSTKFYLADKLAGKPWITRLPFPVHVVERVETRDRIGRNRFVVRYKYHHGYYDGFEREFRGFGMVEQIDTEEIGALNESPEFPHAANIDEASYVPPVLTKTWFHTGAFLEGVRISRQFEAEYYQEELSDDQRQAMLLPDTELPSAIKQPDGSSRPWTLTVEELREAHRALKGAVLRQEVYALDGTEEQSRPYSVSEQNYTIELLQPEFANRHAVFFVHSREAIQFHYERKLFPVGQRRLADPRVSHAMTLAVDAFGNVLKSAAIAYGRRHDDLNPSLTIADRKKQSRIHVTYTENAFTNPIDEADAYRKPLSAETRTYEVLELPELNPAANQPDVTNLFGFAEVANKIAAASDGLHDLAYENFKAEGAPQNEPCRRLIEHVRTLYRRDDLTALLPLGQVHSLAVAGETFKLAFTPGLLSAVYKRGAENLLPDVAAVVGSNGMDGGGYVRSDDLKAAQLFPAADQNDHWWIPSGRTFFSLAAAQELTEARRHFFLPRKFVDPFGRAATVDYDSHDLLGIRTTDALNNVIQSQNDYRVLQPRLITDPNENQTQVAFDTLGMVAATALTNKDNDEGDLLEDSFAADLTNAQLQDFFAAPAQLARELLGSVTTRVVYDLDRFRTSGKPPFAATLARETHFRAPNGEQLQIQISFAYSDGFGREIQKKIQAEPGPDGNPRWVGSGWTIFNNKGKPVRQYQPFFTATHDFEFAKITGVSPTLFYDPAGRVVANLHPNHTWDKVVFDPWQQTTYDVNDTVTIDPRADEDVKDFFKRLPDAEYLPTWFALRNDPQFTNEAERIAAQKAAKHANTPTVAYLDSLGRPFLTIAHNRFERERSDGSIQTFAEEYATRVEQDIEGNQRQVFDATNRVVMRYDYDMLGSQIHQASMEAGERWLLNDVAGKAIRAWDSRGHTFRTEYDALRRPKRSFATATDPQSPNEEICFAVNVYGEEATHAADLNLRGQVLLVCDSAGVVVNQAFDFKGNLLRASRRVAREYKGSVDWNGMNWSAVATALAANPFVLDELLEPFAAFLEDETFASASTFDALNRPITATAPDNSIYRPTFNEANLLERVDVSLRGETETPFVTDVDYDAKGQRTLIRYGNNATTTYEYDELTFRLQRLTTTRPADPDNIAAQIFADATTVQDLHYTYDPVGNITRIEDRALRTVFNHGTVAATCNYIYDAAYRLIDAQGREHIGQTAHDFNSANRRDFDFVGFAHPNDTQALRNYTEVYEYDKVGNFKFVHHKAVNGRWTRGYEYEQDSLLNALQKSNRLTQTTVGSNRTETYSYTDLLGTDVHGCMTSINNMTMEWNFRDQLRQVNLGGGGKAFYVYDGGGQRVRKVIENQNGRRVKERIYVGGFEVYREFDTNDASVKLRRETLHVMDDKQRIALVETKTIDISPLLNPLSLIRYQLSNHLGSSSAELDHEGHVISYEEYHPYGTTAFQVGLLKQYRFTAMERDEETGLSYHGARYFAPWIGKWTATDPSGINGGMNLYEYARNNPCVYHDVDGKEPKEVIELLKEIQNIYRANLKLVSGLIETPQLEGSFAAWLTEGQLTDRFGAGAAQVRYSQTSKVSVDVNVPVKSRLAIDLKKSEKASNSKQLIAQQRNAAAKKDMLVHLRPDSHITYDYTGGFSKSELKEFKKSTKEIRFARGMHKVGQLIDGLMVSPLDAVSLQLDYVMAFAEAKEARKNRGMKHGFATGLAAGLLGKSPEFVKDTFLFDPRSSTPDVVTRVLGAEHLEASAYVSGVISGYVYGKSLPLEKKNQLLGIAFRRLAVKGFQTSEEELFKEYAIRKTGAALLPTVEQMFAEAAKQAEAEEQKRVQQALRHAAKFPFNEIINSLGR